MEADRPKQDEAILRYRIAIERQLEHSAEVDRCGRIEDAGARECEYERLRERGKQLDDDEDVCRAEYEKWNCEEVTHRSADEFNTRVIHDWLRKAELKQKKDEAILRYRIAIEHQLEHSDEMGHCCSIEEYERLRERGKQLDDDEDICRAEYEKLNCEEVTHRSADEFKTGVIRDYEKERTLAELKEAMESKSNGKSL